MPHEVFASKKDAWLMLILASAAVTGAGAGIAMIARGEPAGWVALLVLAGVAFLVFPTHYIITADTLLIRSGLFRWQVPLAQIRSVRPTRNPLSSPALSLDRLEIRYGADHRSILISPENRALFLARLAQAAPQADIQMGSEPPS